MIRKLVERVRKHLTRKESSTNVSKKRRRISKSQTKRLEERRLDGHPDVRLYPTHLMKEGSQFKTRDGKKHVVMHDTAYLAK